MYEEIMDYEDVKGTVRVTVCAKARHRSAERPLGFCVVTTFAPEGEYGAYSEAQVVEAFAGPVFQEPALPSLDELDVSIFFEG